MCAGNGKEREYFQNKTVKISSNCGFQTTIFIIRKSGKCRSRSAKEKFKPTKL